MIQLNLTGLHSKYFKYGRLQWIYMKLHKVAKFKKRNRNKLFLFVKIMSYNARLMLICLTLKLHVTPLSILNVSQRTCSSLTLLFHLCITFSLLYSTLRTHSYVTLQIPYLPEMVAPFITVFGCDEIATLEAVMSVLMWWGHSFHATFPHPPVHIMGEI